MSYLLVHRLLPIWLLWLGLVSVGHCDVAVYTRFFIQLSPNMGGTCANYDMQSIYQEAIDMAIVAVNAIDSYDYDTVARAQIQTYLGISGENLGSLAIARGMFTPRYSNITPFSLLM